MERDGHWYITFSITFRLEDICYKQSILKCILPPVPHETNLIPWAIGLLKGCDSFNVLQNCDNF